MIVAIRTLDGSTVQLDSNQLDQLRSGLRGDLLTATSPGYDMARSIWNGMIDRRPALVVRCRTAADVARSVRFARDHRLLVAVRGGGHNIAGNAVCDGGFMIDLSGMKAVRVNPDARTATVEPGCTLADVDRATQAFGLAVPTGINSTTGIAGLTLGGGFGWLSRRHGMTIDNLLGAQVVTADGKELRATASDNPDLFWAIRGGGGNFGVVTSFEFQLHPVGPEILSGLIIHPFEDAAELLRFHRQFAAGLTDETAAWVVLRKAPPLPFLPEEWHGREVVVLAAFHAGNMKDGERALAPLRAHGRPIADVIGPHPYMGWQQAFDPLLTPGARNYWKSHSFIRLSDELLGTLSHYASRLPSPQCEVFIGQVGGAMNRVAAGATAYPHRDAEYIVNVHARWDAPSDDAACMGWARDLFRDTAAYATGGVYVNFMPEDEGDRIGGAYGANHARLVALKDRYDPTNLFRMNQNIRPSGGASTGPDRLRAPMPR